MYGNQPSQAATLAARMASLGKPPKLGPRPISERPFLNSGRPTPKPGPPYVPPPDSGAVPEGPVAPDDLPPIGEPSGGIVGPPLGAPPWTGVYPPGTIANHNPLFNALRDKILSQTRRPGNQNQTALLARFLGVE